MMRDGDGIVLPPLVDLELVVLEGGEQLYTHPADDCFAQLGPCTIHNRTEHSMRTFPQHWRDDRGIMERICPHGVGHPDPDDFRVRTVKHEGVHGCDGCCHA